VKSNWMPLVAATGAICLAGPVLAQAKTAATTGAKSAATTGSKFAVEINYAKHGKGGTAKFWIKGDKVREEKKSGGGLRVVMITNEQGMFMKNKYSNIWAKLPSSMGHGLVERLLGGPAGDPKPFLKARSAKKTGMEKLNGESCEVWSYRTRKNEERYKLWISATTGKPVKLERDALLGGNFREKITVNYTNFAWNVPVEDALFKVPANEQVREMNRSLLLPQPTAAKAKK
jgi:outer membrane lipoprotein-sorting protein